MTLSKMSLFKIGALLLIIAIALSIITNQDASLSYASIVTSSLRYGVDLLTNFVSRLTEAIMFIKPDFSGTAN